MNELYKKLEQGKFFKLILGLGNEDIDSIAKLVSVYAVAGVDMFDITPDKEVFFALIDAIKSQSLERKDFFVCVSYPIGEDKHGQKAVIDMDNCSECGDCASKCRYDAIKIENQIEIDSKKCIGCGECDCDAIDYKRPSIDIIDSVKEFVELGANCIELHISTSQTNIVINTFADIKNKFPDLPVGVCVSKEKFSENELVELVSELIELNDGKKLIVQADGKSMSGSKDDEDSTIEAVNAGKIFQNLPVYILPSGGTNSKTYKLAQDNNVRINGVSIGSFGRLLIKNEINDEEFCYNDNVFDSALKKAKSLVNSVKKL